MGKVNSQRNQCSSYRFDLYSCISYLAIRIYQQRFSVGTQRWLSSDFTISFKVPLNSFADSLKQLGDDPWWLVVAALSYCSGSWYHIQPALIIIGGAVLGLVRYGVVETLMTLQQFSDVPGIISDCLHVIQSNTAALYRNHILDKSILEALLYPIIAYMQVQSHKAFGARYIVIFESQMEY